MSETRVAVTSGTLRELRELRRGASQGPWRSGGQEHTAIVDALGNTVGWLDSGADATYVIAAVNAVPGMQALIEELHARILYLLNGVTEVREYLRHRQPHTAERLRDVQLRMYDPLRCRPALRDGGIPGDPFHAILSSLSPTPAGGSGPDPELPEVRR